MSSQRDGHVCEIFSELDHRLAYMVTSSKINLKIDLATGNHVSQYHLYHVGRWGSLTREGHQSRSFL